MNGRSAELKSNISFATKPVTPKAPKPPGASSGGAAGAVAGAGKSKFAPAVNKLSSERRSLPIYPVRDELVAAIRANDNVVIVGETGSGKTTQIPQYLYESGFCSGGGMIAVTQPRRVAAISVAKRVATEMGVKLGAEVGYTIRFDDTTSGSTRIKYATDGMLLRETSMDPLLSRYSVIILDEAHERTLHTDILFALLKRIQRTRNAPAATTTAAAATPSAGGVTTAAGDELTITAAQRRSMGPLKVIAMSATLEAEQFATYFGAKILYVSGRQFPVDVLFTAEPQTDYVDAAVITVLQIHLNEPLHRSATDDASADATPDANADGSRPTKRLRADATNKRVMSSTAGDILVFLTGQDEIETARRMLEDKKPKLPRSAANYVVLPLYAALPPDQQMSVFEPSRDANTRKIILSTNIAETSVTIDGIRYVVDSGLVKVRKYQPSTGMDCLVVCPIAQSEAWQRSGRAGRQQPGVCYRLYPEESFSKLTKQIIPEILRSNLSLVVLQLKSVHVHDVLGFEWMTKPKQAAIVRALEQLYAFGALDSNGRLTDLGAKMVAFPLSPAYSRCLLMSGTSEFGCTVEMLSIVSMLSVDTVWVTPPPASTASGGGEDRQRLKASAAKRRFASAEGDHLTLLNVFNTFVAAKDKREWCFENFVNYRSLTKAVQVRAQLTQIYERTELPVLTAGTNTEPVRRCLVSGLFLNAARLQADGRSYKPLAGPSGADAAVAVTASNRAATANTSVQLHPSSVLSLRNPPPECILYNELVFTSKRYMRDCTVIDQRWLPELAPRFYGNESTTSAGHKLRLSSTAQARLSSAGGTGTIAAPQSKHKLTPQPTAAATAPPPNAKPKAVAPPTKRATTNGSVASAPTPSRPAPQPNANANANASTSTANFSTAASAGTAGSGLSKSQKKRRRQQAAAAAAAAAASNGSAASAVGPADDS